MVEKFYTEILLGMIYGDAEEGYTLIEDKIIERARWSILRRAVFEYGNKFYEVIYQDNQPFEDEADANGQVDCYEVFPKEITKTVYRRV